MRIFLSCMQSPNRYPIAAYDFWETYFKRGLEEAGHHWVESEVTDWAEALTMTGEAARSAWRDRTWSQVLRAVRTQTDRGGVDVFLAYLYPHMIERAAIAEIQRLGIPCINFFCDNVREFRAMPESFGCFDLNWVPEFEAVAFYEKAGAKHVFAPYPCWIPPEMRIGGHPETDGVTFVGSRDPLRAHLLGSAIKGGAPISIAGAGWLGEKKPGYAPESDRHKGPLRLLRNQREFIRQHGLGGWLRKFESRVRRLPDVPIPKNRLRGVVSAEEYVRLMQQSRISLGVSRLETFQRPLRRPLNSPRLRDLEAPMMGACYLTEWTETLSHFYDVGRHVEAYRSTDELIGKIDSLLADPQRRQLLRSQGQEHALSELSVPSSLRKVFGALGLRSPRVAAAV